MPGFCTKSIMSLMKLRYEFLFIATPQYAWPWRNVTDDVYCSGKAAALEFLTLYRKSFYAFFESGFSFEGCFIYSRENEPIRYQRLQNIN